MKGCKIKDAKIIATFGLEGITYTLYVTWKHRKSAKIIKTQQTVQSWQDGMDLVNGYKRIRLYKFYP